MQNTTTSPVITVAGVTKDFGATRALDRVDLTVTKGEVVVLLGLSGSGKSTLLRHLDGLDFPTSGTVRVLGEDLPQLRPNALRALRGRVAMIFQQFELVPALTVLENVLTGSLSRLSGPRLGVWSYPKALRTTALGHLDRVGLLEKAYQRADQLSGGQQQRVAIARALAGSPRLLLADEPTGQLDAETGLAVMALLRAIVDSEGVTAVVATHDPVMMALADRVLTIADGRIQA